MPARLVNYLGIFGVAWVKWTEHTRAYGVGITHDRAERCSQFMRKVGDITVRRLIAVCFAFHDEAD